MAHFTQRQTGSVVTYLIVGVLLVAAAIGAIVVVQNRSNSDLTTRPEPAEIAQQKDDERPVQSPEDEQDTPGAPSDTDADTAPAETPAPEGATEAEGEATPSEPAAPQADTAMPTGGVATAQTALPSTGPLQTTLGNVIGLLAILGAGYGYYHFGQRR